MDRYGSLYGTRAVSGYGIIGEHPYLREFIEKDLRGGFDLTIKKKVREILGGFHAMSGYDNVPIDVKPVSVCYAPMFFSALQGMPQNIRDFCALNISGNENNFEDALLKGKDVRDAKYSYTVFFRREDMIANEKFSHVDLLFCDYERNGGKWLSFPEVIAYRNGKKELDFNAQPVHIPVDCLPDYPYVINAAEAVLSDKLVVIRVEDRYEFNRRAVEILKQIYSLLPRRIAVDAGFATYIEPASVSNLSITASIKLFVLPGDANLSLFADREKFKVIDLNGDMDIDDSPVADALMKWAAIPWSARQPLMDSVFSNSRDRRSSMFVKISAQFFEAKNAHETWIREQKATYSGRVQSIHQLTEQLMSDPGAKILPWARADEEALARNLWGRPEPIQDYVTGKFFEAIDAKEPAVRDFAANEYTCGRRFCTSDTIAQSSRERIITLNNTICTLHNDARIAEAKHQTELQERQTALDTEINRHADTTGRLNAEMTARSNAEEKAANAELKRIEAEHARDDAISQKEVAEGQCRQALIDRAAALSDEKTAKEERTKAYEAKDLAEKAQAVAEQERDAAIEERNQAVCDKKSAETERDTAISQRQTAEQERDAAVSELENAKQAKAAAEEELNTAKTDKEQSDKLRQEAEAAKEIAEKDAEKARNDKIAAEKKLRAKTKEIEKGTVTLKKMYTFIGAAFALGALIIGLIWMLTSFAPAESAQTVTNVPAAVSSVESFPADKNGVENASHPATGDPERENDRSEPSAQQGGNQTPSASTSSAEQLP